ncbi:MAG: replicative DNA helicase [Selenomonadaceae bacterium]|nr:replicative DNA helicase [Selenomonadaceae bacterium]
MNKNLPSDINAEKAVIAAMLMTEEAIEKANSILSADDFFQEENRILFQAIADMNSKGQRTDNITLNDHLKKNNLLEKLGGASILFQFSDLISTPANVVAHSKIVKEKAILRRLIEAGESIANEAYEDKDELAAIIEHAENKVFSITSNESSNDFEHIKPIIQRVFSKINYLYEHTDKYTGLVTGFADLDEATSGLQNSDLILIAARPSMGKTAFALNIAYNVSMRIDQNRSKMVAIFSLEMSKEQLAYRFLSMHSKFDSQLIKNGNLNRDDWNKLPLMINDIEKAKLYIDDTSGLTVMEVRSRAKRLKKMYGLDLLIIDYLQLMQGRSRKGGEVNRQQEISEISRSLKALARELNVPVIALSQLSRAVEMRAEKKPLLSDLRESGSLEQDADIVMFLYREDYYNSNTENQNITDVIIAKHRNGPIKTIQLYFDKAHIKFENLAKNMKDSDKTV